MGRLGFDLCYRGPTNRCDLSNYLKLGCGDKFDLWQNMMKEVSLHRFTGPFKTIPFANFVQSPVGLVDEVNNQTRLIFHLSYNFKDFKSINHYTRKELSSIKYRDLDHAVEICCSIGEGCHMAKSDLKSVFRYLPVRPQDRRWLVMKAKHPITIRNGFSLKNVWHSKVLFHVLTSNKFQMHFIIYVVHQQDRLLLSQLRLTFPSSMDGARNRNCSKLPHPSKLDNRTPPTTSDRAQFGA